MNVPNIQKHTLRIARILFVFTVLRIALPAMPPDWNFLLIFRFVLSIFSQELFHYQWALWDLILLLCAIVRILFVPFPKDYSKAKRFLMAIVPAVLVFALTTPLVTFSITASQDVYDGYQDWLRRKQLDATYGEIRDFLEDADVGYAYNTNVQRHDPEFLERFPELASTHPYTDGYETYTGYHVTDVILLDYDTHRVGIVYFRYGDPEFYLYKLHPAEAVPNLHPQSATQLSPPGETFLSYSYSYDLLQYTDALVLTMADGSIYAITGMSKEDDLLFLGLNSTTELLNYWSDQND